MRAHQFFSQLVILELLWLFFLMHYAWISRCAMAPERPAEPVKPRRQRSNEPKLFADLTRKPLCALCEQDATHLKPPPRVPPEPIPPTTRRPRHIDTSKHFCPHAHCKYRGRVGVAACIRTGLGLPVTALASSHARPRAPPVGPDAIALRRPSGTSACPPARQAHLPCHAPPPDRSARGAPPIPSCDGAGRLALGVA